MIVVSQCKPESRMIYHWLRGRLILTRQRPLPRRPEPGLGSSLLHFAQYFLQAWGHVVRSLMTAVVPLQILQEAEEQRVHGHRVHTEERAERIKDLTVASGKNSENLTWQWSSFLSQWIQWGWRKSWVRESDPEQRISSVKDRNIGGPTFISGKCPANAR